MQRQYQVNEKKRKVKKIITGKKQTVPKRSTPPEEQIVSKKDTVKASCDFVIGIALDFD